MCFKKGCGAYRKSIKRDEIEGQFARLLATLAPAMLISVVYSFFVWRTAPDKRVGAEYIV